MNMVDDFIEIFVDMIDKPVAINNKQGFLLKNGMRLILSESVLSLKSRERLSLHYKNRSKR